jgi:hypothetical protein
VLDTQGSQTLLHCKFWNFDIDFIFCGPKWLQMNVNPDSKIRIQCHALAIHSGSQKHLRVIILRNTAKAKRQNIPCHRHRYTLTGKIIPEQVCEIYDFTNF